MGHESSRHQEDPTSGEETGPYRDRWEGSASVLHVSDLSLTYTFLRYGMLTDANI